MGREVKQAAALGSVEWLEIQRFTDDGGGLFEKKPPSIVNRQLGATGSICHGDGTIGGSMHKEVEEYVEARYLALCSPQAAYDWLSNLPRPKPNGRDGKDVLYRLFSGSKDWSAGREATLLNRNDPLIDYALARWGLSAVVAEKLYPRLSTEDRMTMRACHVAGGGPRKPLEADGDQPMQEAAFLLTNPYAPDDLLKLFFTRSGPFEKITDDQFGAMLKLTGSNTWLHQWEYLDDAPERAESYYPMIRTVWALSMSVPVDQNWADNIWHVLDKLSLTNFDQRDEAVERWRIEQPGKDQHHHASFHVRRLLSRGQPDAMHSDDLAVRLGAYSVFHADKYPGWQEIVVRDGVLGGYNLINNTDLFVSAKNRDQMRDVVVQIARDANDNRVYQAFKDAEKKHRDKKPDWFDPKYQ